MKALVVYDSVFGNTKKAAELIRDTLATRYQVSIAKSDELRGVALDGFNLLVVGSPTRAFAPTKAVSGFLSSIGKTDLARTAVACFDTRMDIARVNNGILTFLAGIFGYANDTMEKMISRKRVMHMFPSGAFFVSDSQGPLADGEKDRVTAWAGTLVMTGSEK